MKTKRLIFLFILVLLFHSCDFVSKRIEKRKELEITGIVVKKYRDKWNHNHPIIVLKNGMEIGLRNWETKDDALWRFIEVGDSVDKPSGVFNLKVIKPSGTKKTFRYQE